MLNQNSSIKAARAHPTLSSLEDRESRTGKRNVRFPRHCHKTILAKGQWNSKTHALNPTKLLSSQLLLKSLFYRSPLTFLPRGQPSSGAGWPRVRAVSSSGGFQHPTGQSPAKPCLTSELAPLSAEDRSRDLRSSLPAWTLLLSYVLRAGFWGFWIFFWSKLIRSDAFLLLAG